MVTIIHNEIKDNSNKGNLTQKKHKYSNIQTNKVKHTNTLIQNNKKKVSKKHYYRLYREIDLYNIKFCEKKINHIMEYYRKILKPKKIRLNVHPYCS